MKDDGNAQKVTLRELILRMGRSSHREKIRVAAEFLTVGFCTLAFAFMIVGLSTSLLEKNAAGTRDFVEYWASGRQLVHHANPYDTNAILALEHSAGLHSGTPALVMGNAPPALLLVYPAGLLGPTPGVVLWSLFLLACLVASVQMVRKMHGSPKNHLHFLGYTFAPALICLGAGQLSLFVLLGLVLFLRLERSRPFWAGASLWLCMLKPQLFLPFGLVLLAWIVATRSYRILVGAVSAIGLSALAVEVLDRQVWKQYHQMMSALRYDMLPIPCFSIVLRRSISPNALWLQYLPALLGGIWALAYYRKHREHWDWRTHGLLLTMVSVLVAPYTWFIDQVVLIPALLHGVYVTRSRVLLAVLALTSAVIEVVPLHGIPVLQSPFYLWTVPAWIAWYLYATRAAGPAPASAAQRDEEEGRTQTNAAIESPVGSSV